MAEACRYRVLSSSSLCPACVGGFFFVGACCGFFFFSAGRGAPYASGGLGSRTLFKDGIITNRTDDSLALARNIADLGRA